MVGFFVAAIGVLILALMSISANRRFGDRDMLPMQWSLDRKVNWSTPRAVALAFTPLLASVVMATIAHLLASDPTIQFWTLIAMVTVFAGVHLLHLHLLEKWPAN